MWKIFHISLPEGNLFDVLIELLTIFFHYFSAVNYDNEELNNVKNQLNGEYGGVPDTARYYKVNWFFIIKKSQIS